MKNKDSYYSAYSAGDKNAMSAANAALNAARERIGGYSGGTSGSDYIFPNRQDETPLTQSYGVPSDYMDIQREQERLAREREEEARRLYQQQVQLGTERLNSQRGQVNKSFDDAARQAYISYMQNQKAIPGQLAAAGITGGAAESTMLGAQTAYQGSISDISTAKQQAMSDIDAAITELQNSGDVQTAQYILANRDKIAENYAQNAYSQIARNDTLRNQAKQDAYNEAALTGEYNGKPTYDAQQDAYKRALELASYTGDFSPLKQFGVPDSTIQAAYQTFLDEKTGGGRSGGSRGGVGGYSDYVPEVPAAQSPDISSSLQSLLSKNPVSFVPFMPGVMKKAGEVTPQAKQTQDRGFVHVPGYGRLTWVEVEKMVDRGELIEEIKNGVPSYRKNPNYRR
jgi:hypothetical protein